MNTILSPREIIIGLSIKYHGDWNHIYEAIIRKESPEFEYVEKFRKMTCKAVTIFDPDYPQQLKGISQCPFVLFYYGDISLASNYHNNVSIVGSRKCSEYGIKMTQEIAGGLADKGYIIVSGLALGIDTYAHTTAIYKKGKTIAVLGCGPDICYLKDNLDVYDMIKEDHLVISEYPEGEMPQNWYFPIRNRIIAGLSKTLVVTEAYEKSGSLITAALALMGNGDVMCVPYPADAKSACNDLIRNGAILVESAEDVVSEMANY